MASLDQDSLFSLELVADSLSLSNKVSCRFPAIAFRLLDFPTLIIYHVEPHLGEAIKKKIKIEPQVQVPEQLVDLKDRHGVYQVKKGKSCLFKVPPNILLSHLQNTPLYVMVIDTYPSTPKLVGNCIVPLDMTMNIVYNDIKKLGISVPVSHGEKGTYKIFNLMGVEIGEVTFGFRLLSLGVGLMSHIPDKSVVKMQKVGIVKKSESVTQASQKPMEQEAAEIILEDLETADQNVQVVLSTPRPAVNMNETQTDFNLQKVANTQTEFREIKKKKLKKEEKRINRVDTLTTLAQINPPCDDIIITSTVCPPALFYNSEADPPCIAPGLTLDDYLVHKQRRDAMTADSDTESVNSDSTIRHEDRFSDSELEIKPTVKTISEYPQHKPKKQPKKSSQPVVSLGAMAEFPLLSALMSEIVSLHGVAQVGTADGRIGSRSHTQKKVQISPSNGSAPHTDTSPSKKSLRPVSPTRTYMLRKAMSAALIAKPLEQVPSQPSQHASPEQVLSEPGHSPRRLPTSAKQTTTKGNKQKPQVPAVTSTNLMPGMTKSQRLRLSMTNPSLLEKLEKDEKERVEKFKAKRMAIGAGFYASQIEVSTNKHSVDSDQYDRYKRKVPKLQLHANPRKPVPTPRKSISEDQIVVREVPPVVPRKSKHTMEEKEEHYDYDYEEDYEMAPSEREEPSQSSNSARSHTIEVHMPSAHLDNTASDYDEMEKREFGKTFSTRPNSEPHIPPSRKKTEPFGGNFAHKGLGAQSTEPISVQYSKDYNDEIKVSEIAHTVEGVDAGEVLGLRRMVDTYSDDDDDDDDAAIGAGEGLTKVDDYPEYKTPVGRGAGEELGLREIVDKYSSNEENDSSEDSQEYHSVKSNEYREPEKSKPNLKISTSLVRTVAPSNSDMSPSIATKQPKLATRNPMTESLSTVDESNPDSTAYIHRSDLSQFSSIESTGTGAIDFKSARKNTRKPMASPRKSLDRVHTESVSSYAPSDPDIGHLSPTAEYSDNFESAESEDDMNVKYMKDAELAPEARFGYTWSGS